MACGMGVGQEKLVDGPQRLGVAMQNVKVDAVRIELRAEEIALIRRTEPRAPVPDQARGCDPRKLGHYRHQIAGALEFAYHPVPFRIDTPPLPVHQRVTLAVARILEVGHGANGFARGQENQLDWIIEAAARHPLKSGAVRTHAPNARRFSFELAAVPGLDVVTMTAIGEIQPSVRAEEGAMKARGIGREVPTGDD